MKKLTVLLLVLVFPVSGMGSTAVLSSHAGTTNMVSAYDDTKPILLASADDSMPLVAEAGLGGAPTTGSSSADDDLSFLDDDDDVIEVWDPIEPVNRGIFWFNDKLYFYLMKPIARGYRWLVPEPVRVSVGNAFSNLATPIRLVNSGLQGKFGDAGNELTRFGINSTIGILGLFDTAKDHFNIEKKKEDTGQTLGYWGLGPGPYLVLPILGPSSARDGIGLLADSRMDLIYYMLEHTEYWATIAFRAINTLSLDKDTYEGIVRDELDPYLFVRDAWAQYRQNLVEN